MDSIIERVPPHSIEAEQAVLACILVDVECIATAMEKLEPTSFYRRAHGALYEAMLGLYRKGEPIDLITMRDACQGADWYDELGGYGYLIDLAGSIPTTAYVGPYADIVAAKARRREFIRAASGMVAAGFDEACDDPVGEGLKSLVALDLKRGVSGEWKLLADLEAENYDRMAAASDARREGRTLTHLMETGFYDLDNMLAAGPGDMLVLAARTGYGKTALAANIAIHVATTGPVAMFTLEMSGLAMARRFTASHTGIDTRRQVVGSLGDNEWPVVQEMIREHRDLPLYIRDKSHVTVSEMLAACRKLEAQTREKLKLVVVDYLTLADADGKVENETTRAAKVSRGLKLMAGELGCPVLALAQLNRGVDGRPEKRPELRDLKQSGSIEQDASVVIFIHREGHRDGEKLESGPVEVIVAKNRHGSTGSVNLNFDAPRTRFSSAGFDPQELPYGI
jgi:replicative DNA helicase